MPAAICSPQRIPGLHQSLCEQRMKTFLEIAFIGDQAPELVGFPSLLQWIECCIAKETVNMPVWIAQPVNWSEIPMEKLTLRLRTERLPPEAVRRPPFKGGSEGNCG
jgi:hypothetical protein